MKKKLILACGVAALAVFAVSCKDNSAFTISGIVKNPGSIKKIYLMEADSTMVKMVDSTDLNDKGKFEFKHQAPYADLYKIRLGSSSFDLIAKNGDAIDFATDAMDNSHAYTITGSDESDKIQKFNAINNIYGEKNTKLVAEYQQKAQALGHQSDSLLNIYRPIFEKNVADAADATLKFVKENKGSLAGFYAATALDPNRYERELIAFADELKANPIDNPGVRQFIRQMEKAKPISIGHKAPEFTITSIDNKPIKLADYKGKYVMIDFWASWCGPCRMENPNVVKQYNTFKSKGFNILGISLDKQIGEWKKAVADDKLTWAHGSDLQGFEGPTEALYHIEAIPSNFIIDPQGVIVAKNITGADLEAFLTKTFK